MGQKQWLAVGVTAIILVGTFYSAQASSDTAGSQADPLVTKSYVDKQISEISTIIGKQNSNGNIDTEALQKLIQAEINQQTTGNSTTFQVVELAPGEKIIGGEGCEIILRSGAGIVYSEGIDGLSDLTDGTNLSHGNKAEANHLLLVPRADRRGVLAQTAAFFLVKGTFTIE